MPDDMTPEALATLDEDEQSGYSRALRGSVPGVLNRACQMEAQRQVALYRLLVEARQELGAAQKARMGNLAALAEAHDAQDKLRATRDALQDELTEALRERKHATLCTLEQGQIIVGLEAERDELTALIRQAISIADECEEGRLYQFMRDWEAGAEITLAKIAGQRKETP